VVIKDREGEAKLLICDENGKIFRWKMIDGKIYVIRVTICFVSGLMSFTLREGKRRIC
jgi:hypothetical protein